MSFIKKFFITLVALDVLLIVLHFLFGSRFDLLHLDRERTFATYYSGLKLMAIAVFGIGAMVLSRRRWDRVLWAAFSFLFAGLSFDEVSELHENVAYYFNTYVHLPSWFSSPTYNWLVFLSPAILGAFAFLCYFFFRLSYESRGIRYLLWSGFIFFLGAVASEMVSGVMVFDIRRYIPWLFIVEESFEMFGATVLVVGIAALAKHYFEKQYMLRNI